MAVFSTHTFDGNSLEPLASYIPGAVAQPESDSAVEEHVRGPRERRPEPGGAEPEGRNSEGSWTRERVEGVVQRHRAGMEAAPGSVPGRYRRGARGQER